MSQTLSLQNQLIRIVQLQELDLKIDALSKQKNALPAALQALDDELAGLNRQIVTKAAALEEVQKKERQTKAAVDLNKERETRSGEKLAGVSNSQEFQAANKEIDQLKRQQATLGEHVKGISAEVASASAALAALKTKMEQVQAKRDAEAQKISGETSQLAGQADGLIAERSQYTLQVEKRILALYDRVRGGRAGVGIAPAVSGRCGVCNMMVPPQMYNELHKGKDLHSCPSCNRILYVPGQPTT